MFSIDWSRYRLVDLSVAISAPGTEERPFVVTEGRLVDDTQKYDITNTHTHVGTHVESPRHYYMAGKGCEDYPLADYMGRGVLLDVSDATANAIIDSAWLEAEFGDFVREGDILLARNSDPRRKELGKAGRPLVTCDGAKWMAARKIGMFGFDNGFKLGGGIPETREAHDILMSQDIMLIEIVDLSGLTQREFYYIGLPIAFVGLDSAWCRAVAIEER
jgi:arylformamidase